VSALNVFSVLDMLLKSKNVYLFKIAVILIFVAAGVAFSLVATGNNLLIASFTLIIELSAWVMYEYVIKKSPVQNV